jgi:hypothetical protein
VVVRYEPRTALARFRVNILDSTPRPFDGVFSNRKLGEAPLRRLDAVVRENIAIVSNNLVQVVP